MPHWVKNSTVICGCRLTLIILFCNLLHLTAADNEFVSKRRYLANYVSSYYPEQLESPQVKKRKSMSQFGYNLYFTTFPLFPIRQFIDPKNFGDHSYGKHASGEKNGALYTCKGGFIDMSHIRAGIDWTVFLTFKTIVENGEFELPAQEGGKMKIAFRNLDELSTKDIALMAQKIAFERLTWHEIASWYYHRPNRTFNEQQSTFTPEDIYSDFLGTWIGRTVALRILQGTDSNSFSTIVNQEIEKAIAQLQPVEGEKATALAYDIVDRNKQLKLPEGERNNDVWWDSKILFRDHRYVFKRYINTGPALKPWLVPAAERIGCPENTEAKTFMVPQSTGKGAMLNDYYTFTITPDSALFFTKQGKQLHPVIDAFTTQQMQGAISQVKSEMEKDLNPDFDKRNLSDPVPSFKQVRRVIFK